MLRLRTGDDRKDVAASARLLALFALVWLAAGAGAARAEWEGTLKAERFRWAESTQPGVTETGPRFGLGLGWTQDREIGPAAAWRGELYGGSVRYSGAELFPPNNPVSGTTEYTGFLTELQGLYRWSAASLVGGLGFDYWNRQLTDVQKEEWTVVYARAGAEYGRRTRPGFYAAGGVKYPLYVVEDAHLDDIGFDQNPSLHPGRAPSLYAEAGYRFGPHWALTAYYDSYRFRKSSEERVTSGGSSFLVFQPESKADMFGLRLHLFFH